MPLKIPYWYESTPRPKPLHFLVHDNLVSLFLPSSLGPPDPSAPTPWLGDLFSLLGGGLGPVPVGTQIAHIAPDSGHLVLRVPPSRVQPLKAGFKQVGVRVQTVATEETEKLFYRLTGELVVRRAAGASAAALGSPGGWTYRRTLSYAPGAHVFDPPASWDPAQLAAVCVSLESRGRDVTAVYPVALLDPVNAGPADMMPWHLKGRAAAIKATDPDTTGADAVSAWGLSAGGAGVTIAIVEHGPIDTAHIQFSGTIRGKPKLAGEAGFEDSLDGAPGPMPPVDGAYHGTCVASAALARGAEEVDAAGATHGACGVAPNAHLLAVTIGAGGALLCGVQEADALHYAGANADLICCAWGPWSAPGALSRMPDHTRWALDAVLGARGSGRCRAVCFSAGNKAEVGHTTDLSEYASYSEAITVGACTAWGQWAPYSNPGRAVACLFPSSAGIAGSTNPANYVSVAEPTGPLGLKRGPAPAGSYIATFPGQTSTAGAGVCGVLALMLAACPRATREQLREHLLRACVPIGGGGEGRGAGRVNTYIAVRGIACVRGLAWPVDAEQLIDLGWQ